MNHSIMGLRRVSTFFSRARGHHRSKFARRLATLMRSPGDLCAQRRPIWMHHWSSDKCSGSCNLVSMISVIPIGCPSLYLNLCDKLYVISELFLLIWYDSAPANFSKKVLVRVRPRHWYSTITTGRGAMHPPHESELEHHHDLLKHFQQSEANQVE